MHKFDEHKVSGSQPREIELHCDMEAGREIILFGLQSSVTSYINVI